MIKAMMVGLVLAGGSYVVSHECPNAALCESCGCRAGESCAHVKGDTPTHTDAGQGWPRTRCFAPDAGEHKR